MFYASICFFRSRVQRVKGFSFRFYMGFEGDERACQRFRLSEGGQGCKVVVSGVLNAGVKWVRSLPRAFIRPVSSMVVVCVSF